VRWLGDAKSQKGHFSSDKWPFSFGAHRFYLSVMADNELGKGDHRHVADGEEPYLFTSLEGLFADFERDVREAQKK